MSCPVLLCINGGFTRVVKVCVKRKWIHFFRLSVSCVSSGSCVQSSGIWLMEKKIITLIRQFGKMLNFPFYYLLFPFFVFNFTFLPTGVCEGHAVMSGFERTIGDMRLFISSLFDFTGLRWHSGSWWSVGRLTQFLSTFELKQHQRFFFFRVEGVFFCLFVFLKKDVGCV